jgi:hypothetical protein
MGKQKNFIEKALAKLSLPPPLFGGRYPRDIWRNTKLLQRASSDGLWYTLSLLEEFKALIASDEEQKKTKITARSVAKQGANGNWSLVALYLREGRPVTDEIRAFLSDVLDRKKRSPNRPPSGKTALLHGKITALVIRSVRDGKSAARSYREAADRFGLTPDTVEDICKQKLPAHIWWVRQSEFYEREFTAVNEAMLRVVTELRRRGEDRRPRYFISEGG